MLCIYNYSKDRIYVHGNKCKSNKISYDNCK